jgi:hypothetical protein
MTRRKRERECVYRIKAVSNVTFSAYFNGSPEPPFHTPQGCIFDGRGIGE